MVADDVTYQPDRGDFVFLNFTPQAGTEQAGRRPALVVSPREFNIATGLVTVCPLTRTQTGSRFEVSVPRASKLSGVVLSHQFRTVDWLARDITFHSKAPTDFVAEIIARIEAIMVTP